MTLDELRVHARAFIAALQDADAAETFEPATPEREVRISERLETAHRHAAVIAEWHGAAIAEPVA